MPISEAARAALELINKQFPKAPLSSLGQSSRAKVSSFPTGSLILNQLFGIGGWPRGRLVELYGKAHSGKTTLCHHAVAEVQRYGVAAFIDTEHRADMDYACGIGVDIDSLIFDQPSSGEEAFEKIIALAGVVDLVILDSLAHTKPKNIHDTSKLESANVGSHGKLSTKCFEILGKNLGKTTVIVTNHLKRNMEGYEYTPGGDALLFDADLRVRLTAKPPEEDDDFQTRTVTAKVYKNSCGGLPYRSAEFILRHGRGIAIEDDTLEAAILAGVMERTKNGFHSLIINEKKTTVSRGKEGALSWLKEKDRLEKVRSLVAKSDWYQGKITSPSQEGSLIQGEGSGVPSEVSSDEMPSVHGAEGDTIHGPTSSMGQGQ